jgi:hypothetical protein
MKKAQAESVIELLKSINILLTQLTFHVMKQDMDRKLKEDNIIRKSNNILKDN